MRRLPPIIAKKYGIDESGSTSPSLQSKQTSRFKKIPVEDNTVTSTEELFKPVVEVRSLSECEVKRRAGFHGGVKAVLRYLILVCNGDFGCMTSTASTHMTWFEEWFLYLEVVYGKTWTRWQDVLKMYNICERTFYHVLDSKIQLVKRCRNSWPRFASHEEDVKLRGQKWNEKYGNKRCILWDDTNGPFTFKPSTALNQRRTWSSYYASNCAKAGVFVQFCGWIGVDELFPGAISDSLYVEKTNILKIQKEFAEKDLVNGKYVPFTIIVDKGYRIITLAWVAGKQECVQPTFAKSDRQFTTNEMLVSATVAADRSGNERAVRYAKLLGFIQRGLKPRTCPRRFNDVWLAWSFQTNFMYKSVL